MKLAERIRAAIADSAFPDVDQVTMSIGVAEMRDDLTTKTLEARADRALYEAKDAGRNRVKLARA